MLTNVFMNVGALAVEYTREEINEMLWQVPLLGMLMVFSVLAILWGVLTIFKLVFVGKSPKAQKPQKETKTEKAAGATQNDAELMAVLSAAVAAHQSNDEIIAVLTAAVSAYREQEGNTSGFRVVAFKRQNSRAWNRK